MVTKRLHETPIMETAHKVDARNLYDTSEAMITVITLQPGQSLKRHITPVDVAFYGLEGTGEVEIGNERQEVSKDTLVESPKDIVHCWYNTSADPLKFMVIKAPQPTRKTIFTADGDPPPTARADNPDRLFFMIGLTAVKEIGLAVRCLRGDVSIMVDIP